MTFRIIVDGGCSSGTALGLSALQVPWEEACAGVEQPLEFTVGRAPRSFQGGNAEVIVALVKKPELVCLARWLVRVGGGFFFF